MLGQNDGMADDILQIFSNVDGRFSREKLSDKLPEDDRRACAVLDRALNSLDCRISQYVSTNHPIWADSTDSSAFLDAVDALISTLREWGPLYGDKSVKTWLVSANDLMQQAMFRIEDEFRSLMEQGAESFDSNRNDSDDENDENERGALQNGLDDDDEQIPVAQPVANYDIIIDALPSGTINDLHEIAKDMVAAEFEKECSHVYSTRRREFLEESISRLGLQRLNIEEVHKMTWQNLEDQIECWIKSANVALRILSPASAASTIAYSSVSPPPPISLSWKSVEALPFSCSTSQTRLPILRSVAIQLCALCS